MVEFEVAIWVDGNEVLRERLTGDEMIAQRLAHAQIAAEASDLGLLWRMTITDVEGELPPLIMGSDQAGMRKPIPIHSGAEAMGVYDAVAVAWDPKEKTWRENLR